MLELSNCVKLPPICYTYLRGGNKEVIAIKNGENGYYEVITNATPEQMNSQLPRVPTAAEILAMEAGSMFGWQVPGANPDTYADLNK